MAPVGGRDGLDPDSHHGNTPHPSHRRHVRIRDGDIRRLACACSLAGLPSHTLKSEIEQVRGLQEVSSECDLPDHDLPTKNMKCYVTNGKGHKELVEIRVSKDGTKLGLYDTGGKALKTTGKG